MKRVDANLIPFAKNNPSGYRFAFGTDTATDDINVNYNDNIKKGWGTTPNEFPEVEDFNAMAYTASYLIAYLYQMGISEWNASQNYRANSRVIASDGNLYKSLTGTSETPNTGNNPLSDVVNWKSLEAVSLTGNQTVAGIKTFTSSPIVPAPTTDTQAANKQYADLKVALADFTGANVNKSVNGYQKLPNGLILQWGSTLSSAVGYSDFTYPIAFPNSVLTIIPISFIGGGASRFTVTLDTNESNYYKARVSCWNGDNQSSLAGQVGVNWLVIGY